MSSEAQTLARRQLEAYNAGDLDAFCACFHEAVEVLEPDGAVRMKGIAAFRERYGTMFATHEGVHATVLARLQLGAHVVEYEKWSRTERGTGQTLTGEVLVRYTEADGRIRWVEFLR